MIKRKPILWVGGALLLAGAMFAGYRTFVGEAAGSIKPVSLKPEAPAKMITISSQYAEFQYPDRYKVLKAGAPVSPVVKNYSFADKESVSSQIAIQITKLTNGNLNDDSGYNYRSVNSKRFEKSPRTINGKEFVVFIDREAAGFDRVAYLQSAGLSASIAFSGSIRATDQQLAEDLRGIVTSWIWK